MTPDQVITIVGSGLTGGGMAMLLIRRGLAKFDDIGKRVHDIEVQMAGSLATKNDVDRVSERLDLVDTTLRGVQLILARLEGQLNTVPPRKE